MVEVGCSMCSRKCKVETTVPEDFVEAHGFQIDAYTVYTLCPDHAHLVDWVQNQCDGCVGGFGDCDLFSAFAYSSGPIQLSENDFSSIKCGICPKRTNGSMTFDSRTGAIGYPDFSKQATNEAGVKLANDILTYRKNYCDEK